MTDTTATLVIKNNISKISKLSTIEKNINELMGKGIAALEEPFTHLSDPKIIRELVLNEVSSFDKLGMDPYDGVETEIYLFKSNDFVVSLKSLGVVNLRSRKMIAGLTVDIYISNPTFNHMEIPLFEEFLENKIRFIRNAPAIKLAPGQVKYFANDSRYIPDFDSMGEGIVMTLYSKPLKRDIWVYNRKTMRAEYKAAVSPNDSRCSISCKLITETPTPDTPSTLKLVATSHPAHFVRWEAIRSLAKIDPASAESLLRVACNDPHPQVAQAARTTLIRISETKQ